MKLLTQNKIYFIFLSVLILFIDQLTKSLIIDMKESIQSYKLILFNLDYVKNYGAAFNILSGSRIFLSTISIIISLVLVYLIIRNKGLNIIDYYSYSFILGGTLGNGIDRIFKGYVIDFINLNFINFPVFNIADISINIGFVLIIYSLFKNKK